MAMGSLARTDAYDPMSGALIGAADPPPDPREGLPYWALQAADNPNPTQSGVGMWPAYSPPKELPDVGPPAIPSGPTWEGNPTANRVADKMGDLAITSVLPQDPLDAGLMLATGPGRVGYKIAAGAMGAVLNPDEAQAMFAGRLAKTANLGALKLAEDMAGRGASQYKIRQATGWFQGPDAKWRFEIPDTASKWKDTPSQFTNVSPEGRLSHDTSAALGDIFEHSDLYAAYPELSKADVNLSHAPGGMKGSYQTGGSGSPPTITVGARDPESMRSTLLHEMQHGVQDIEGFATGGNTSVLHTKSPGWGIYQERLKAIQTPRSKAELEASGITGPDYTYEDYLKQHKAALKNPDSARMFDRAAQDYAVKEGYKRLAGEVEARNVQTRADWTPGRLKNVPPWSETSQDVPTNKQIVRMGALAEPQEARWVKHPFNRIAVGDTIENLAKRNAYAPSKTITENTIQPHDIPVGSWLTPLVGDRSRSGELLTYIGEKELANPVSLQGGYQFTPEWKGEGVAWASDRSPISTMGRRVREFQGRDIPGVYGVYTPMSTQSIDASHHVSDALSQMMKLEKDNISKTAIEKFDAKMGGDFPGVTSENLQEYLRGKPMSYRNDFVKAMNTKAAREAGFPDVEQARIAITHPDLIDTPNYAGGNAIAKLTGEVSHYNKGGGLAPHYTYPSKLHGEYMGGLAEALPQELLWRDLAPKIAARNPSAAGKIWLTGLKGEPFGQQVDRQWQDAAAEYFRRQQRGD